MKPVVWTEVELAHEAGTRLAAVAEILTGASVDSLPGADVAIIGGTRVDDVFLEQAGPRLKMIVRHGIGYDRVDVQACTAAGVLAANTPDGPTESTAEHAVALLLALAKRLRMADEVMRAGDQSARAALQGIEVRGRTLGVVGFGRIGGRVSEICALGLGMKVIVHDPFALDAISGCQWVEAVSSLDDLLAQSDIVTLHTPLSGATWHLIGARELGMMKKTAYLINVSRGPVVDELALIDALRGGRLAGAGLDVFDPEPPAANNPLFMMAEVIVTPHVAANTGAGTSRMSNSVVDQILQVLNGQRPESLIDEAAWPGRVADNQET